MQTRVLNTNDIRNIHRDTNQVGNRVKNKIKKNINVILFGSPKTYIFLIT
jgi:hypothetical protein